MRRPTALTFAFLLPLGCGTTPSSDDEAADDSSTDDSGTDESSTTGEPDQWDEFVEPLAGSRLRPLIRTVEDGTRIHVGWQDTSFDTPCVFAATPTAGMRCVPTTAGDTVRLYADANCSEPVLEDIWIPEGATVVAQYGWDCFDDTYYEIGEAVTETYGNANGPCEFHSSGPAHRVTVIPHESLVAATVTPLPGTSRIVPLLLEAEDGARQIFGAWDRTHEEEVAAAPDAGKQLRWLGRWQPSVSTFYYADANCTEPLAVAECVPDAEQPTTARATDGYCGGSLGRSELLEEVGQRYRKDANDVCQLDNWMSGTIRQWRVGAPLDESDFAVSSTVDGGGPRIRHDIYTNPEGEPFLASGRVYDHEIAGMECRWRDPVTQSNDPSTSATFDCVPTETTALNGRYQDSSCTQPTAVDVVFEDLCPSPARYVYKDGLAGKITGMVSGEGNFGLDAQGVCTSLTPSPPPDGNGVFEYYVVGAMTEVAHAVDVIE